MWRKASEGRDAGLCGESKYSQQAPPSRVVPLWGGVGAGGFAEVLIHKKRKSTAEEWMDAVDGGKLSAAVSRVNPTKPRGPWHIICDNESFLRASGCGAAYRRAKVTLWKLPPRSPDLNPVEKHWGWLRKTLLKKDLEDLRLGKRPLDRVAYIARIRGINKSARAQMVAGNLTNGLMNVCHKVQLASGGHTGT